LRVSAFTKVTDESSHSQYESSLELIFFPYLVTARNESQRLASTIPSNSTLVDASTWNKNGKSVTDYKDSKRNSTYELHTMDKITGW